MPLIEINPRKERTILVGMISDRRKLSELEEELAELARLADTAGAYVIGRVVQHKTTPNPTYYIGKGKVEEIRALSEEHKADLIIFDAELAPTQVHNLEEIIERRVIDRSELIMDIFALHARTAEAKIQVELAQLQYRYSRLVGSGIEMSDLGGGIGTRGPGETKLEVDRRKIRDRITHLNDELKKVQASRKVQRQSRQPFYKICLVGYTNAGKSTVMNLFSSAGVKVEDRLFSTLDTTTRIVNLSNGEKILLSDTVGFIRKLPHQLISSFRTTLEEVLEADLLLHIVDASYPEVEKQITAVDSVLTEIGGEAKPILLVFNKIDKVENQIIHCLCSRYPISVAISALQGEGREALEREILNCLNNLETKIERTITMPVHASKALAWIHSNGEVISKNYHQKVVEVKVRMKPQTFARLNKLFPIINENYTDRHR
ncbi:MAG: GTPase HflX [Candidatus Edwardsbacteria bacterium]